MRNTKSDEPTLSEVILDLYNHWLEGSRTEKILDQYNHDDHDDLQAILFAELISAIREQNSSLQSITSALTQLQR